MAILEEISEQMSKILEHLESMATHMETMATKLDEISEKVGQEPGWFGSGFDLGDKLGEISSSLEDMRSTLSSIESNTSGS
jgi:hypothetical protein